MNGTALLRYLALPFTVAPLLLVAIFAVLLQVALHAGLLGLPLLYIVGSWFLKYAFVLLEHTAQGRPGAPVFSMENANPLGETRPFLFGLLIATCYGVGRALGSALGDGWATATYVLGMTMLPAVIAIEAVTGSFVEALQPRGVAAMIRRLGPGYLIVMAIAATLWLARPVDRHRCRASRTAAAHRVGDAALARAVFNAGRSHPRAPVRDRLRTRTLARGDATQAGGRAATRARPVRRPGLRGVPRGFLDQRMGVDTAASRPGRRRARRIRMAVSARGGMGESRAREPGCT